MTKNIITEDGEQLDVTEKERKHLVREKLIYWCRGCASYHLNSTYTPRGRTYSQGEFKDVGGLDQVTWEEVEQELKDLATANFAASLKNRRFKRSSVHHC